jgi:hypothetical protein
METTKPPKLRKPKAKAKAAAKAPARPKAAVVEPAEPKRPKKPALSYSLELADRICAAIAEGHTLRTACSDPDMPSTASVMKWQRERPEFAQALDRAREFRADSRIEEIADVCAKVLRCEIDPHAARVGLDNLWKLAGRENWKKWGERQAIAIANVSAPAEAAHSTSTADELIAEINRLASRMVSNPYKQLAVEEAQEEIIEPPKPFHSPREELADRIAGKARPPTIDNIEPVRNEPSPHKKPGEEPSKEPEKSGEFGQLKCSKERPATLDRQSHPYVIGNSHFERWR